MTLDLGRAQQKIYMKCQVSLDPLTGFSIFIRRDKKKIVYDPEGTVGV